MTDGREICEEKADVVDGSEELDRERFSGASWDSREEYLGGDPRGSLMGPGGGRM
jgi:hypothetical protein